MAHIDLLLLHAPSVYDFRQKAIMYGPVSDLIPSSPVFEMYPLGFLTTTTYLEERGMRVRVVNLALRMMNDPQFDVPAFLARLKPRAIGIDLHWLPHAHGSLEVAHICKTKHPDVPVIFGGLSSTYFHELLINYPQVDYVLRGDCTEPPLYELLQHLFRGQRPDNVPNLTWKDGGRVRINPFTFSPESLDYVDIRPDRMVSMVLRYRDLKSVLPFNGWWQNPITAIFTVKGCAHGCITCGSSNEACALLNKRSRPLYRSPQNLVKNIRDISHLSRGPIFLVGDLRQAGDDHAYQVLDLLGSTKIKNEIVFELFDMPPAGYLAAIDAAVDNWSLELSPESHDETIRAKQDDTVGFSNAKMEAIIEEALRLRCHRLDIFFMIGLAQQTRQSVMETIDYCEYLFQISDRRLSCFISPMGPFLDPASRAFEAPEQFGYHLFAHSLEEHRHLLVQPSWKHILNYETDWMSREDLVEVTYDAGERLNALKLQYQRIIPAHGEAVAKHIRQARALKDKFNRLEENDSLDSEMYQELQGEIYTYSVSTTCDKRELFWQGHSINFRLKGILKGVWAYLTGLNPH